MKLLSNSSSILYKLVLLFLALWSLYSFGRIITRTIRENVGNDFHNFWYSGQFIRQRTDPLHATFLNEDLNLPVCFLDGKCVETLPVQQKGLGTVPVNTAPMQLMTSLLSFFSWPVAKTLWMILNLACILIIPWLLIQLLPDKEQSAKFSTFIFLTFWCFLPARNAAVLGNSALFVFTCMLLSLLLYKKYWFLSGLILGIALSKYSLSIPLFIYFLYKKEFKLIIASLLVQIVGLLALAWIAQTSPFTILSEYLQIFLYIAGLPGTQLSNIVSQRIEIIFLVAAIFSFCIFGVVAWWVKISSHYQEIQENPDIDFLILVILFLWSTLVLYHLEYDVFIAIAYIGFLATILSSEKWNVTPILRIASFISIVFTVMWLIRPGEILLWFSPDISKQRMMEVTSFITTILLSFDLIMALVFLYNLLQSLSNKKSFLPISRRLSKREAGW